MTFERTTDPAVIKSIVTHPKVYPHVTDDFSPSPDNWQAPIHETTCYVLVKDGGEVLGLWAFWRQNPICWQVHTCLLPNAYGDRAKQAVRELADWVWTNTPALRVITEVPEYNRLALRFALLAGMKEYGRNWRAYQKHGELHTLILLGISKPGAQ